MAGTAGPAVPLHIVRDSAGNYFTLENTDGVSSGAYSQMRLLSGTRSGYLWVRNQSGGGEGDGAFNVYAGTGDLNLWAGSIRHVTIKSGGNVGIGTTNPTQKLDVAGNITANLMYDRNNTGYYVDPASTSRLNAVSPNAITMYGDLNLNGSRITGGQALDGQVCQIAIYASVQGGGIKWNYAQWIDSSGWQRLGTVGGAIIDSQKIYNIAIKCK